MVRKDDKYILIIILSTFFFLIKISKRYGQNSSGQFGAVPATYVELLSNESKSNQQNDDSDTRRISIANYQPRLEEERQDSVNDQTNVI